VVAENQHEAKSFGVFLGGCGLSSLQVQGRGGSRFASRMCARGSLV
jgi:hypothetical protein